MYLIIIVKQLLPKIQCYFKFNKKALKCMCIYKDSAYA